MNLLHAVNLAQARSYVAALANQASTIEASSAYERVLIELDRIHDDESPALDTHGLSEDRAILVAVATDVIEELEHHGINPLNVELILAMLEDAYALDGS